MITALASAITEFRLAIFGEAGLASALRFVFRSRTVRHSPGRPPLSVSALRAIHIRPALHSAPLASRQDVMAHSPCHTVAFGNRRQPPA